jgi:uncharacterized membrane protein
MNIVRLVMIGLGLSLCVAAHATPDFLKEFKVVYPGSNATCKTCHTEPPKRNDFGKAVGAALDETGEQALTKKLLETIEKKDSDGDGFSNIDEINAGTLPGDPKSKPAPKTETTASNEPTKPASSELIPKHSFHPAIVHFPIALLAIAAWLELLSKRKKGDHILHKASEINLAIGLVTAIGGVITGVAAWLRLGYAIEGDLLIHLLIASTSILVGIGAYYQRSKPNYLILILISGVLVLAAAHFGGNMVYG